jgi:hypothetical protein
MKWALSLVLIVLAHLGFEFLFQGVELALISIEIVVIAGLLQVSHNLAWRVVEVSLLTIWTQLSLLKLRFNGRVLTFHWDGFQFSKWLLLWSE